MIDKKKTAPDAGTSKGGNGDNFRSIIPRYADPVKWELEHMHQKPGDLCPRCEEYKLTEKEHISLYADVRVCEACVDDEHFDAATGQPHLLPEDWDYIKAVKSK